MESISFFEKSNEIDEATTISNSEFKSVLPPPKIEHLHSFKESIYELARNIEFKSINTVF